MSQTRNSLINRETTAKTKDIYPDQKGIEVKNFSMSKGVQLVGRTGAALHSEKQQQLISCINRGMNGLRQHCRTSSKCRSHIFARCDCKVGANRRIHYFFLSR